MSLKDCVIKTEYRSLIDNVITEFYIPLLSEAKIYRRAVGLFFIDCFNRNIKRYI